ncbi:hypothetical protein Droror1_Dr00017930 [Drosera rotundifolia]
MHQTEILSPYTIPYSDLVILSSSSPFIDERLRSVYRSIVETLGPAGSGFLAVTGVAGASRLRESVLPLARDLAIMSHDQRKRILKDHNLGSDIPLKNLDRHVSSFVMQLNFQHRSVSKAQSFQNRGNQNSVEEYMEPEKSSSSADQKFNNLGSNFKELGFRMMELGLCIARICDRANGSHELEQSLLDAGSAKGRLIHYHSALDTVIIKESGKKRGSRKNYDSLKFCHSEDTLEGCITGSDLWQQWHYDYGTFTVLTSPMFISPSFSETADARDECISPCTKECPSPSGHSCLQIFDPKKNKIFVIKAPPDSCIVQVGESADVLSRGKLRSTLHSVCRPSGLEMFSRETFVVFLQPAWNKVFDISGYPKELLSSYDYSFEEFSRETTRQYYGGMGVQSKR